MLKKLLIFVGVLAVLAIVGVVVLLENLDGIVKSGVERVGTQATQTDVTVDGVKLELRSGAGELNGVTIANPEGYESEHAFHLGRIRLQVDTATIGSNPVVIKEITVEEPQVIYEVDRSMGTNIGTIQDSVAAFMERVGGGGGKTPSEKPAGNEQKFIIEELNFNGGRVAVSASSLGGKHVGTDLPALEMTDIGKAEGGLTGEQIGAVILKALTDNALKAAKKVNLEEWLEEEVVDKATDAIKGVFGK